MNKYFIERQSCPCCDCSINSEIYRASYTEPPISVSLDEFYSPQGCIEFEYLERQEYFVCECNQCGLLYQREIPDDFLMKKLYDKWIDPEKILNGIEKNRSIGYFASISDEIIRIMRYFNVPPRELSFLDYSMGWGHWCRVAQSFGCGVHGTEFSSARLEYAKRTGVKTVEYDELPHNYYDFINTEQVFEHLPNPQTVLSRLKKCLKPNGLLKISVPNGANIKQKLKKSDWKAKKESSNSLNPIAPLEHVNCFNKENLIQFARGLDFTPIDIEKEKGINVMLKRTKAGLMPFYHMAKTGHFPSRKVESNICLFFTPSSLEP